MDDQLYNRIFSEHIKILKNIDNISKIKIMICFSGVPASGKTTFASLLEKRYNAIRINKDDIGKIILSLGITDKDKDKENITDSYIYNLIINNKFKNKIFILDKSIDRQYKEIFKILTDNGYGIYVIRMFISKDKVISRIKLRNKIEKDIWLLKVDKWFRDFEDCKKNIKSNIDYYNEKDIERIYQDLDILIND